MKNLITLLLFTWLFPVNGQTPLYEEKIKGNHANSAAGTQTVIVGRIFTTVNGTILPIKGIITIEGYHKDIKINEGGYYWVEISELVRSGKRIKISCRAKNYKAQEYVLNRPFTNEYKKDFELVPTLKQKATSK